ncbi:hypothetical protein [Phocaeicola acetigenes]|jgi:hypothetical protein|uniref:Dihydroorotase catalytic domain-containing protein n=1 Tax=Phocaeicola acetigenes TaxID=3016083 RepID=A0ABT4PGE8_9BACT|nr:hypothetical protein [Phocaeicola sp. KGMB11183]MCZ8372113.1 hypothetical protein [Phocaeicola sp. KGMB11183]
MRKKGFAAFAALSFIAFQLSAQDLKPTQWKAYGVSFKAPSDISIEDDSEEGYIVYNDTYYITVQMLDGEGIKQSELATELKNIATDDEVTEQTPVKTFELPHFYGVQLQGKCETDRCIYSYLLARDGGSGFYVSIVYKQENDPNPERILKSFALED